MTRFIFKGCLVLCLYLLFCGASFAFTAESDILKRLEKLEREVDTLRKENAELRQQVSGDQQQKQAENVLLRQMVETDRKEIDELKKSAGRLGSSGLQAVLGRYDMQLYGRVKVDLNYDTGEMSGYGDLIGMVDDGDAENDSTNFNPRDTRLGVKVAGRDGSWLSEARMEMDFYGDNNGNNLIPRMRLGYIKLTNDDWGSSLLIGQDWIPVAGLNPPMIEFGIMSGSGNLWWRVPQVTFRKKVDNFELLLSAMKHRRISYEEEDRMPWVLAKISYDNGILGQGGHFAIGGGWKSSTVGNGDYVWNDEGSPINTIDNSVDRWLLCLELKLKIGKKLTFMAEPWIGQGIDKEFLRYRMGINNHHNVAGRRADLILSRGGWLSLTYAASSKMNMSIGYGIDDPDADDMEGMMDGSYDKYQFTKNETYFLNSWFSVTSAVKMGFEVQYKETERFSDVNNALRYTFSTVYNF